MAHHSMPEPDGGPSKPASSSGGRLTNAVGTTESGAHLRIESDLAQLAAKFAAPGGGNLSAELSADLALEVVLNEITAQACLATGATGAAVILERDGEMVCRASSGANAPELGARLGSKSGLTAECMKTRRVQRCDDAQADPRVDSEACRGLGVRSVMVLPLLRNGELAGVLEVFSSRAEAFGERDELTLKAVARQVLENVERASKPFGTAPQNPTAMPVPSTSATELEESQAGSTSLKEREEDGFGGETLGRRARTGLDVVTFALGVVVVGCAVLLASLVGLRLGWRRTASGRGQVTKSTEAASGTNTVSPPAASEAASSKARVSEKNAAARPKALVAGSIDSSQPAGGLSIYENGKEVFRMLPTVEESEATKARVTSGTEAQRASAVEPAGMLEVPPEVAEGSLLYRVEPEYPEEARQQQIQGLVVLEVRADRDGAVQGVKLLGGQRVLANAAIAAVKQWRFRPRMIQGQPVEMQTRVVLTFRLPR